VSDAWTDLLAGAEPPEHPVQIYSDVGELAGSVAAHLAAGFEAGERALVVATRLHARRFAERLAALGWDEETIERRGLLLRADAHVTLEQVMDGDMPSPTRFDRVIGGLVDEAARPLFGRRVRIFGELVDILCRRGQADAAIALEGLWNRLVRTRNVSLFCGYRLDVFDRATQTGPLPGICATHSHVLPAADPGRLASAVDRALDEVLGPDEAGKVYFLVGRQAREQRVPVAQLLLMWVSANIPVLADRILASARAHYARDPAASVAG
jgi:hypothetical protein